MENNNEKTKNKSKIVVVVLSVFLLLCAVISASVFLTQKEDETVEIAGETTENGVENSVSDEETLRKLLEEESELEIRLTEDICIDNPICVNGTKTLTGSGCLSMELYVFPYQYMLEIQKGASLTLDGITVDGGGSANCIKVEKEATLTCLSGELTYGCPTIIESFGDVHIKGGSITDAIGTGVYVHSGGNAYMTGGTIQGCVDCGIETAGDGYLSISGDALLQDNMEYFVYNRGTCDITGGVLKNALSDLVFTSGVMNVKYPGEDDGMLAWSNIGGCGFVIGKGGNLNVDKLHMKDVEKCAVVTTNRESISNISNSVFENIKGDSIYVTAEVNLTNVEIKNSNRSAILLVQTGKMNVDNVTVTDAVKDGIQNGGGVVTGKNFVVNNAGRIGVNSYKYKDVAGSVTLKNVTVNGTKNSNGLHVETSTLTVTNAKIKNTGNEGARAQKAGTLKLTNVEIQNAKGHSIASYDAGSKVIVQNVKTTGGKRGIGAFGGDVKATKVTINNPIEYGVTGSAKSVVEVTDLTIKDSGKTGVNANNATINIVNATIQDPKATAGVNADYNGKVTLKNADIKFTKGTAGKIDGVKAVSPATVTLEKVNVVNASQHGIYANGAKAKISITDITTTGGKRGIQIYKGGKVEGKNVSITSPTEYGITCGDKGSGFNLTNVTITGCGKHGVNIYDSAMATVTDVTITEPANLGVFVGNKGELTLNKVTIAKTKESALMNNNGSLTLVGGSVDEAGEHGVYTYKTGQTTLTDVEIKDSKKHNIRVDNAGSKCVLTNVSTSGGERGVQIYNGGAVEGNTVTITSPTAYGIACGDENSSFNITGLTVLDTKNHAVNVYGKAKATVTNGTIKNPGINGVNVEASDVTLDNVDITFDEETTGDFEGVKAYAKDNVVSTINLSDVNITNAPEHGIQIWQGSKVTGNSVTITSPGASGILCADSGSDFNIKVLNISGSGKHSIDLNDGASGSITEGIIQEAGAKGIYLRKNNVCGASVELTDVQINKSKDENLYLYNASSAIVNGTLTLTGGETHSLAVYDGSKVEKGKDYSKIEIDSPGNIGIRLCDKGSQLNVGDLILTNCKDHGVFISAQAQAVFDGNVNIQGASSGNLDCLYVTGASSQATINGTLTTTGGRYGLGIFSGGKVIKGEKYSKITINSSRSHGAVVMNNSELRVGDMTLTGCAGDGIHMRYDTPTVTLTGQVNISQTTGNAIDAYVGNLVAETAKINVTTANYGLRVRGGVTNIGELNIDGAKAYSSVYIQGNGTNVTINGGVIKNSQQHGINVKETATLNLKNYTIQSIGLKDGATYYEIQNEGGKATINLENVTPNSIHKM